jgi:carboxymethylenebutenolidase
MPADKPRLTAKDFDPEVLSLFDKYVHGGIDRRGFLDGAARFAVGGVSAAALLEALSPKFAQAQQVPPADPRIRTESVEFASPKGYGKVRAYVARPAQASGPLPVVLVVHENRGLNPHIEDIARRLALDNFIAVAPDALFPLGGYPGDEDKAREMFAKQDAAKRTEDLMTGVTFAKSRPESNGKIGAIGFCFGGGMVNAMAVRFPDLAAGVPYYGVQPPAADVPKINAALMIHYAGNDPRINDGWPAYEKALKANGKKYEMFTYPNTEHGFHNDTTPRYDEAAAKLSWQRTVDFFAKNLRGA